MDSSTFTIEDQIKTVENRFRHIVILGAGASIASSIHNPNNNGLTLPSMDNLIQVLKLEELFLAHDVKFDNQNFENVFSSVFEENPGSKLLVDLEAAVYDYFDNLNLPDTPTIYDYLILSLRKKDLIATFNWDPFLLQAFARNMSFTNNLPHLAFLHGNVAVGICEEDRTFGPKYQTSLISGKSFQPVKLLYPISKKDYNSDKYISSQWSLLSQGLENPARVTIFGYSAPKTDKEAIKIMSKSYGPSEKKMFTQFEIIDTKDKNKIQRSWKKFIFSHHYEIHNNFFESTIAKFPRRTGEVFYHNLIMGKWYQENWIRQGKTFDEVWDWYSQFLKYEN